MRKSIIALGLLFLVGLLFSVYAQSALKIQNYAIRSAVSEPQTLYFKIKTVKADTALLAKEALKCTTATGPFDCTCTCGSCEGNCYNTCHGCALEGNVTLVGTLAARGRLNVSGSVPASRESPVNPVKGDQVSLRY